MGTINTVLPIPGGGLFTFFSVVPYTVALVGATHFGAGRKNIKTSNFFS